MTDSDRLAKIETRQEALIQVVTHLVGVVETTNVTLAEVVLWMKEPPSSDLPDVIRELIKAVQEMKGSVDRLVSQQPDAGKS